MTSAPRPVPRLLAIQGLRGLAVLLVVLYHAGAPIGAGYVGVDVFFVISGFVITRLVLSRSATTLRLSLRDFWASRVRRLAPALAVAILLTLVLSIPFTSPVGVQGDTGITAVAGVVWFANVVLATLTLGYFADSAAQNPLLHLWSLAVEEQFYIAFPLMVVGVLWWVRRRGGSRIRSLATVVAIATLLSLAASIYLTYAKLPIGVGPTLAFYSPVTRAWEFGVGALTAMIPALVSARRGQWIAASGAAILLLGLVVIDDPTVFPGYIALLPVVGAALMCHAASSSGENVLSSRPMVWLGDRSYGWYLYHWPLIVLVGEYVTSAGAALIGLGIAHLSLRYVEDPIRHRRRWAKLTAPRLWLVSSVPVVVGTALLMIASSQHWWSNDVESYALSVSRGTHPVQSECQSVTPLTERDMTSCTFGPKDDESPIILVGDSNAGMYADMAVRAAASTGHKITIATVPSCQVADLASARPKVRLTFAVDCHARYHDTIAWLEAQPPSTVLVASGASTPDIPEFILVDEKRRVFASGREKQAAWAQSLARAYTAIQAQGHRVAAVELIPQWVEPDNTGWSPRDCRLVDLLRDRTGCERRVSLADMDERQRRTLAAASEAATATGASTIPVRDSLCPSGECGTSRNGLGLYSDSAHLTPTGADLVMTRFAELMSQLPRDLDPSVPTPGEPTEPGAPGGPGEPGVPTEPGAPDVPGVPPTPSVPGLPDAPDLPGLPGLPDVPAVPTAPVVPSVQGASNLR